MKNDRVKMMEKALRLMGFKMNKHFDVWEARLMLNWERCRR